jgi:phytoene/squalene synthetase
VRLPISPPSQSNRHCIETHNTRMAGMVHETVHGANHYENFPVGSLLLPAGIRAEVLSVYGLARLADDIADEGNASSEQRLARLGAIRACLTSGQATGEDKTDQACAALANTLGQRGLSLNWMLKLLTAFEYDADHRPFADWAAVYHYCEHSANPVGRMMLGLAGLNPDDRTATDPEERLTLASADAICTGLQLVNFAQDFGQDLVRGRPTLPRSEWPCPDVPAWTGLDNETRQRMVLALLDRGERCLQHGEPLLRQLKAQLSPSLRRRLSIEIEATRLGGLAIAARIRQDPLACWTVGPKLGVLTFARVFLTAVIRYSRAS